MRRRDFLKQTGAAALATAGHLGSLRCLDLSGSDLSDEGVRAIALAPPWVGLRELNLATTGIGPAGVGVLGRTVAFFAGRAAVQV